MTKGETAKTIFEQGYNCAQSVLMAYCEDFGINKTDAAKMACGLGGGIARTRETCGAVLGAIMVLGLKYSSGSPEDKKEVYRIGSEFIKIFEQKKNSSICRVLLDLPKGENSPVPEPRTQEYYGNRPCAELVRFSADLLEKMIND